MQPLQILYVEDNAIVREITHELLCRDERNIVALGSAEAALDEFRRRPCDILITDISLPLMSGVDLVRNILSMNPRLPVIIASGYALNFRPENWGANVRSITKPFESAEMDTLIAAMVSR
jgi:two-component system, cell cycle response regulator CpdR